MEIGYNKTKCPQCKTETNQAFIKNEVVEVRYCPECSSAWQVVGNFIGKLIHQRPLPETDNYNLLCPFCWSEMYPDYDNWLLKCPDPLCGNQRRLTGLDKDQRQAQEELEEVRAEVMRIALDGGLPDEATAARYKALRERVSNFSKENSTKSHKANVQFELRKNKLFVDGL